MNERVHAMHRAADSSEYCIRQWQIYNNVLTLFQLPRKLCSLSLSSGYSPPHSSDKRYVLCDISFLFDITFLCPMPSMQLRLDFAIFFNSSSTIDEMFICFQLSKTTKDEISCFRKSPIWKRDISLSSCFQISRNRFQ